MPEIRVAVSEELDRYLDAIVKRGFSAARRSSSGRL